MPEVSDPVFLALLAGVIAALIGALVWLRRKARRARQRAAANIERVGEMAIKGAIRTAARVREEGLGAAFREPVTAIADWAEVEHPELRRAARDGSVTLLFSDIENSTAINEDLGDRRWMRILHAHESLVRKQVEANDGHVVKSQGDGFMVAFATPAEALRCAIEVQRTLAAGGRPFKKTPIKVRIGIHSGKTVARRGDLYGRNVALAARVAEKAGGGQILVSGEVKERVKGDGEIKFGRQRKVELKGLGKHAIAPVKWEQPDEDAGQ